MLTIHEAQGSIPRAGYEQNKNVPQWGEGWLCVTSLLFPSDYMLDQLMQHVHFLQSWAVGRTRQIPALCEDLVIRMKACHLRLRILRTWCYRAVVADLRGVHTAPTRGTAVEMTYIRNMDHHRPPTARSNKEQATHRHNYFLSGWRPHPMQTSPYPPFQQQTSVSNWDDTWSILSQKS